ncbi:aminotransferase class I/II-fold pyridoxal phosphate-dependent enzyme [Estrella lausannensis]|uniref:8-amino-7-oxononanoate synthase n=1 Tax=Estrella lausannensis TaxID=483423 RepID=A0A0H5DSU2_9BACT|nr:aminotransferase class I/II-fold pyridoxal phosphate-dependent enzyme [Estrella lausannensis]CRX38879.1 8-amino-7-oxononanoate synthase [Estrella lausannensis]
MDSIFARMQRREKDGTKRRLRYDLGLIDLASNDYLGLARSSTLSAFCQKALNRRREDDLHGFGSTGSRLMTGNHPEMERVEEFIAKSQGFESALLFSSGYMANVGALSSLPDEGETILYDAECHASLLDGIRLSKARAYPFRHNDLCHLKKRLSATACRKATYIVTESVFSTDGSTAPLKELDNLAASFGAGMIVDDAHGIGLFYEEGKNSLATLKTVVAATAGCGKALGVMGGVVLTTKRIREFLLNFGKTAIYSTALPLASLYAIEGAFSQLPFLEREREKLFSLIRLFQTGSRNLSMTAIQPVNVRGNEAAVKLQEQFKQSGFLVKALLSPTVRKNRECLRITLHAFNTEEEVKRALELLS